VYVIQRDGTDRLVDGRKQFWLPSSSDPFIFKKLKSFSKIMKTNLDIINDVTYKHIKFHYEILDIMGFTLVEKRASIRPH
jgi:hypothetical protein